MTQTLIALVTVAAVVAIGIVLWRALRRRSVDGTRADVGANPSKAEIPWPAATAAVDRVLQPMRVPAGADPDQALAFVLEELERSGISCRPASNVIHEMHGWPTRVAWAYTEDGEEIYVVVVAGGAREMRVAAGQWLGMGADLYLRVVGTEQVPEDVQFVLSDAPAARLERQLKQDDLVPAAAEVARAPELAAEAAEAVSDALGIDLDVDRPEQTLRAIDSIVLTSVRRSGLGPDGEVGEEEMLPALVLVALGLIAGECARNHLPGEWRWAPKLSLDEGERGGTIADSDGFPSITSATGTLNIAQKVLKGYLMGDSDQVWHLVEISRSRFAGEG